MVVSSSAAPWLTWSRATTLRGCGSAIIRLSGPTVAMASALRTRPPAACGLAAAHLRERRQQLAHRPGIGRAVQPQAQPAGLLEQRVDVLGVSRPWSVMWRVRSTPMLAAAVLEGPRVALAPVGGLAGGLGRARGGDRLAAGEQHHPQLAVGQPLAGLGHQALRLGTADQRIHQQLRLQAQAPGHRRGHVVGPAERCVLRPQRRGAGCRPWCAPRTARRCAATAPPGRARRRRRRARRRRPGRWASGRGSPACRAFRWPGRRRPGWGVESGRAFMAG